MTIRPAGTNALPNAMARKSNGVAEYSNNAFAPTPWARHEMVVMSAVGISCTAPTVMPTNPNSATAPSPRSRGDCTRIRTIAARPVRTQYGGWPPSAWIPQNTPARAISPRVGAGRRQSNGNSTHGIQP
ncbi:MAG: hypothetical protein WKF78_07425 [Candidatus Limnocylindrales bacterium]